MKKLITLILVLALCIGVLPMGVLAADRKPVPKKVTYENSGDAPAVEVEYEDSGDFKWVEFYLLGDKAKEGDLKGPLGLIDIRGVLYHLLGIQNIDTGNRDQFHKDEKTGLYTARGQLYLGGEKAPAAGKNVGFVIETGEDNGSMRKSDVISMKVPARGKKTVYVDEKGKIVKLTFKSNGGKGRMASLKLKRGEKTAIPLNTFTRSKYEFIEWNTRQKGSGKAYKDGSKITVKEDTTLYAQWGEIALTLGDIPSVKRGSQLKLKASLKVNGKAVRNRKVIFTFNGKTYAAKTNRKGVARVTIKGSATKELSKKSVTIKVSYGGVTAKRKVKVSD